jgi:hypothetical protein
MRGGRRGTSAAAYRPHPASTSRVHTGMSRREIQNKVAVAVFALFMVGIIGLVIYFVVKNKQQASSGQ